MPSLPYSDVGTADTQNTSKYMEILLDSSWIEAEQWELVAAFPPSNAVPLGELCRLFDRVLLRCTSTSILGISATGRHIGLCPELVTHGENYVFIFVRVLLCKLPIHWL